jgi:hypothetical protein
MIQLTYSKCTKYKYITRKPITFHVFDDLTNHNACTSHISLLDGQLTDRTANIGMIVLSGGSLHIMPGYAWDGASGPSIDTKAMIKASLLHDALYQLIRAGALPSSLREECDNMFHWYLRKFGMTKFRAWYVHKAVRMFGAKACRNGVEQQEKYITI